MKVWLNSFLISDSRKPSAESTPGLGGTITGIAAEQLGQRVRVQAAGAAEGDERELARIEPALHRDDPQRAEHRLVDDVDDRPPPPPRRRGPRLAEPRDRGARGLDVELHLAAEQPRRQVPEHDVGVGDGRLVPPRP